MKKIRKVIKEICFMIFYVIITFSGIFGVIIEIGLHPFLKLYNGLLEGREDLKDKIEKMLGIILLVFMACWSLIVVLLHPFGMAAAFIIGVLLEKLSGPSSEPPLIYIMWITAMFLLTFL